ncbi:MFS transporter [Streptomyces sp.]|uniref:MFS transporter n=1 Tax=Streptomyces sp. TaxID=1931 RepID=UPI002F404721
MTSAAAEQVPCESAAAVPRPGPGGRPALVLVHLFTVYATLALGMGLVPALLASFRAAYGLSGTQLANIQNVKDLGLIVAMAAGPFVIRRAGTTATVMLALLTGLAGCAAFVSRPAYGAVLVGATLHGAAFSLGSLAAVTHLFRLPERYRHISAMFATFGLASFGAPALVALSSAYGGGYRAIHLAFAGALVLLLAATAGLRRADGRTVAPPDRTPGTGLSRSVLRAWLPGTVVFTMIMAGETIVVSWITLLGADRYGMTLGEASALLATLWAVHTPARALGDILIRRLTAQVVVVSGALLSAGAVALLCLGGGALAYVGVVLFAAGVGPLVPVCQGRVLSRVPPALHGTCNASLGIAAAAGTTLMIWLTGLTIDADTRLPFVTATVLMLAVAAVAPSVLRPPPGR